ncbi:MAG TPA: hypothetical protein VKA48_08345 [Gammaproteobacteria bacterium]|nr:hypothetical protein [Gammaproteobacteria bacterium]
MEIAEIVATLVADSTILAGCVLLVLSHWLQGKNRQLLQEISDLLGERERLLDEVHAALDRQEAD